METREETLSRLAYMLGQLHPDIRLTIGVRYLARVFGGTDQDAVSRAEEFARGRGCSFQFDRATELGTFVRARPIVGNA